MSIVQPFPESSRGGDPEKPRHGGARRRHTKRRLDDRWQWRAAASLLAEFHADAGVASRKELVDGLDHVLKSNRFDGECKKAFRQLRRLAKSKAPRQCFRIYATSMLREATHYLAPENNRRSDVERFDADDVAGRTGAAGRKLPAFPEDAQGGIA